MIGIREGMVIEMSYNKYPKEMKEAVVAKMLISEAIDCEPANKLA